MSVWSKLMTGLRGAANEAGETVADKNALRILDQEIRDADNNLRKAKDSLTTVMAQRKQAERKRAELDEKIEEYMNNAQKAIDSGKEDLALEVAERVAEMEGERANQDALVTEFSESETGLKATIGKTERSLAGMKRQVATVKANESVIKAQSAVASRHSGSKSSLRSATDSLERIKERQAMQKDKFAAAEELAEAGSDSDLDAKLAKAGITPSGRSDAADVLARIKSRSGASASG